MKSLRNGPGQVDSHVRELAELLLERYPEDIALLTGVVLRDPERGVPLLGDLVTVTPGAVIVSVDGARALEDGAGPSGVGRLVQQLQRRLDLVPGLRVYPCWLRQAPADTQGLPVLEGVTSLQSFILRASAQNSPLAREQWQALVDGLLHPERVGAAPTPPLRRALRHLFGDRQAPVRPADLGRQLRAVMLERKNHLEDANYGRVVPNRFTVEVDAPLYDQQYRPIAEDLCEQWRKQLLRDLNTANSRQGRKELRFGGPVQVLLRPAADVGQNQVAITAEVVADEGARAGLDNGAGSGVSCLEAVGGRTRYVLPDGMTTLGRSRQCDVCLGDTQVREQRLVSGRHAYIVCESGRCRIFDGTPEGRPSLNGTYVNRRPISPAGQWLYDGDEIIFAALDPQDPRPDTPGTVLFTFRAQCER